MNPGTHTHIECMTNIINNNNINNFYINPGV